MRKFKTNYYSQQITEVETFAETPKTVKYVNERGNTVTEYKVTEHQGFYDSLEEAKQAIINVYRLKNEQLMRNFKFNMSKIRIAEALTEFDVKKEWLQQIHTDHNY